MTLWTDKSEQERFVSMWKKKFLQNLKIILIVFGL